MTDINRYTLYRSGKHPIFTSTENRSTHIAENRDKNDVRQFKIDGEVFPAMTEPQRCDYLLLNDTKRAAYFIELKGKQVSKAINQIEATIDEIKGSIPQYSIQRRIVTSRGTHGVQHQSITRWKQKYGSSAKFQTSPMRDII